MRYTVFGGIIDMDTYALLSGAEIDFMAAVARLALSFVACGLIGIEREWRRQTAGLRTHIIIGLGATLLMMLSAWVPQRLAPGNDPGRIAAQVVSGIGFLGAGAFLKIGNNVKGLTTASSLWFVAGLGLTIGAGMFEISIAGLGFALLTLVLLEKVERRLFPSERYKVLQLWYEGKMPPRASIEGVLKRYRIPMQSFDAELSFAKKSARISMLVKVPSRVDYDELFSDLKAVGKVQKVRLREDY